MALRRKYRRSSTHSHECGAVSKWKPRLHIAFLPCTSKAIFRIKPQNWIIMMAFSQSQKCFGFLFSHSCNIITLSTEKKNLCTSGLWSTLGLTLTSPCPCSFGIPGRLQERTKQTVRRAFKEPQRTQKIKSKTFFIILENDIWETDLT